MRRALPLAVLFACSAAAAAARGDDAKDAPKTPANVRGEWTVVGVTTKERTLTTAVAGFTLTLGDRAAEWSAIPGFTEEAGKGAFAARGKGGAGEVEFKVGDATYKGIYRTFDDQPLRQLDLLLGHPGKAAPKAFSKDFLKLPADASVQLSLMPKKK